MTRRVVYLVGEPGVGKSTAVAAATDGYDRLVVDEQPRRELLVGPDGVVAAVELGARRGRHPSGYPGTDALPMNTITRVEQWLLSGEAAAEAPVVLGEGARLGIRRFVDAALGADWHVDLVHLVDPVVAYARRLGRGSQQSPAWTKGAATRAARIHAYAADLAAAQPDQIAAHQTNARDVATLLRQLTGLTPPTR